MSNLSAGILFLIFMFVFVNLGGVVRLKFFNNLPWEEVKKVLIIANALVVIIFIAYCIFR